MEYLRKTFNLSESEYLTFDAIRQASQCVGRVIRSKSDYGLMIFADEVPESHAISVLISSLQRYSRIDKRRKLPQWITQYIDNAHLSLSTDQAVQVAQDFLKKMAQPRLKVSQQWLNQLNLDKLQTLQQNDFGITMLDERQASARNDEFQRSRLPS